MPEPSRIGRMFTPILSTSPAAKSDCASSPNLKVRLRVPGTDTRLPLSAVKSQPKRSVAIGLR